MLIVSVKLRFRSSEESFKPLSPSRLIYYGPFLDGSSMLHVGMSVYVLSCGRTAAHSVSSVVLDSNLK